jgi:rhodanese-related sulfurtransferase
MKIFSTLKWVFWVLFFLRFTSVYAEAPAEISGVKTVDAVAAKTLYQQGAVFIDVRDKFSWNSGHILGSVNLDFNDDAFIILYVSDELDKDTPLVFYCDSALEPNAAMASFFAASWGYKQVYFFRDGYYAWLAADFPVEYQVASQ